MWKIVINLLSILLTISSGTSLTCYSCTNNTCHQNETVWSRVPICGSSCSTENCIGVCLTQIYYIGDAKSQLYTERMCVNAETVQGKVTFNCNSEERTAIVCHTCREDFCNALINAASKNVCTVLLIPVLGFLIFS